jgi:lipopolysaccharide transport system ATP-binding protein
MNTDTAIKVTNLSKVYTLRHPRTDENGVETNEHWALKDVSFEIKKGESVGIIGPNGSGKSTLLKILAGVTKPSSGTVEIRGKVASILDIGAGFHPELSGRENVFLNGQIHGFSKKEIERKFDEIVAFSGIEKFIDEPVKNYSNGMYLRLAFSIMAHLDFDVYLFDEVLSVGDAEFQKESKEKLQKLVSSNKVFVFVSHNISEFNNLNFFIHVEKGEINNIGDNTKLIDEYIENNIIKLGEEIRTKNVIVSDFSKHLKSNFIEIKEVKLFQHDDVLKTDNETYFDLLFNKTNNIGNIDFAITIFDIYGTPIITSTPMLNLKTKCSKSGVYQFKCVFPANIFGYQAYKIGLIFIENIFDILEGSNNNISLTERKMSDLKKNVYQLDDVIVFKLQLKIDNTKINLKNLNISGGLLPVLKWESHYLY